MSEHTYEISAIRLMEQLGRDPQDPAQLQQVLDQLMGIMLDEPPLPSAQMWQQAKLLGSVQMEKGMLQFEFSELAIQILREKHISPEQMLLDRAKRGG